MSTEKKIETLLSSPESKGSIIVAFTPNCSIEDVKTLEKSISVRNSLKNSNLPQSIFMADCSLVFAQREQFNVPEYKSKFLEKCNDLGKVTIIAI